MAIVAQPPQGGLPVYSVSVGYPSVVEPLTTTPTTPVAQLSPRAGQGVVIETVATGYMSYASPLYAVIAPEAITSAMWGPSFPAILPRPSIQYLVQRFVCGAAADDIGAFLADKWMRQPSEPVRQRIFPTALHPFYARYSETYGLPVETVTVDKWWQQASEPVRWLSRPRALDPNSAWTPEVWPSAQVVALEWFQQASEPARMRGVEHAYLSVVPVEYPGLMAVPDLSWQPAFPAWNARAATYAWLQAPYDWGFDYTTTHAPTIYMLYAMLRRRRRGTWQLSNSKR